VLALEVLLFQHTLTINVHNQLDQMSSVSFNGRGHLYTSHARRHEVFRRLSSMLACEERFHVLFGRLFQRYETEVEFMSGKVSFDDGGSLVI
jgi:hypothetical protein